ncbi:MULTISPECIES: UxaA family hydrolase [Saliphagus]|uniref:UxaA family hydrolase n=1 Tax=Saliphagus infecundisoli TaxID=1849069 RepID=A0ABD5QC90_9EURY|nr:MULTISPECIES: UxaA family hydrolase [Saliphagus]
MSTADARTAENRREPGIRDRVLILPSVICSHEVTEEIADRVPGAVATPHDHGCAQIGRDNDRTARTLVAMGDHPNVAGCVVVGLGCEHVQSDALAGRIADRGVPVRELSIQSVGGTDACLEEGVAAAEELRADHAVENGGPDLGDLTVGVVSTDLAEPTVGRAEPLVGEFVDRVRSAGGRVVVAGTERVRAHPDAARERFVGDREAIEELLSDRGEPARAPRVAREAGEYAPAEVGRLWGEGRIEEVVAYGDRPAPDSGLALVDSASRFEEAATGVVAAGAHIVVHVTGDGIPTGHPLAPVLKVSATRATLEAVGADIDVDARETDAAGLARRVRETAAGEPCRAERHGVTSFAIERAGPSL